MKIQCDVFETLTILFSHLFLLLEFLSHLLHFALPLVPSFTVSRHVLCLHALCMYNLFWNSYNRWHLYKDIDFGNGELFCQP